MIEKLKAFTGANGVEANLFEKFKELAEYFVLGGYFLVNNERKVYLCDVEFYYHEEEGAVKDYIMYHRNNRYGKNVILKYFEVGQLNAHESGVDITFECEAQKYRASMLIRGFKIKDPNPEKYDDLCTKKYDVRSKYFYEALLNHGSIGDGLKIEWVENEGKSEYELAEPTFRQNVAEYDKDQNKIEHIGLNTEENKKCQGPKFKQCMRPWRFHIK